MCPFFVFCYLVYVANTLLNHFFPLFGRCYNMHVFPARFSFPEGRLSHLLSTDYLASQNSLPDTLTQKMRMLTFMHAQLHILRETGFIGPLPIPPLGVIVHGCMCFLGPQTQTVMGRGGGGGAMEGERGGGPYKDGARCYNNCVLMVQWLFLQLTRP